jgi:succinate dehydrogenase/fumarate reductase cytochrome b subunit
MATSILFRGTGIAATLGVAAFAITAPFSRPWKERVAGLQEYTLLNALVKFGVVFSGAYHLLGGLRHLQWDAVRGHTMPTIVQSGRAAVGLAAAAGLYAAVYEHDPEDV